MGRAVPEHVGSGSGSRVERGRHTSRTPPAQAPRRGRGPDRALPTRADRAAAHAPGRARHRSRRPAVPRRARRPARRERLRAMPGPSARAAALSPDEAPHRSHAGPTTFGTLPSPPGSTEAFRLLRWRSGPGTASTSCCGSTPSASPARTTPSAAGSRRPCGRGAHDRVRDASVDTRRQGSPAGHSRTARKRPSHRVSAGRGRSGWWWRVEDSNLCSFRDGFTVRSHWPLGQPAGCAQARTEAYDSEEPGPAGARSRRIRWPTRRSTS